MPDAIGKRIRGRIDEGLREALKDSTEYELRLYIEDAGYPFEDTECAGELLLERHQKTPLQKQTLTAIITYCTTESTVHKARELLGLKQQEIEGSAP
jgi:hypothetical protein